MGLILMSDLANKRCEPCQGGVPPLKEEECEKFMSDIDKGWALVDVHHLRRVWAFPDFLTALDFLNSAGAICEQEGHHADFEVGWGRVEARIWTHKIDGLTESDFVLAAKFDQL
tara:strand:- start:1230 stop:1571 length:342 start_codon:yes stop_codon:yes gene_type:complete